MNVKMESNETQDKVVDHFILGFLTRQFLQNQGEFFEGALVSLTQRKWYQYSQRSQPIISEPSSPSVQLGQIHLLSSGSFKDLSFLFKDLVAFLIFCFSISFFRFLLDLSFSSSVLLFLIFFLDFFNSSLASNSILTEQFKQNHFSSSFGSMTIFWQGQWNLKSIKVKLDIRFSFFKIILYYQSKHLSHPIIGDPSSGLEQLGQ